MAWDQQIRRNTTADAQLWQEIPYTPLSAELRILLELQRDMQKVLESVTLLNTPPLKAHAGSTLGPVMVRGQCDNAVG